MASLSLRMCRAAPRLLVRPLVRPVSAWAPRSYSSASDATVPLAYDLHRPERPVADDKTKPILFLHGLFGSKKNNRSMSKVLARDLGRSVYALDLRNHGDSPHAPRHDYTALANDVAAFIGDHGLTETTVIGHSMGAKTAMVLALAQPDLVADLVAIDNAPWDKAIGSEFGKYVRGMKDVEARRVTRLSDADRVLQPYEDNVVVRQFLLGNLQRAKGETELRFCFPVDTLAKALGHMGDFPYTDPAHVRFNKPALFVRGTKSAYVPDESLPVIGQFFPRFELVDIDAGHWVVSERPEQFRQAVVSFLTRDQD